MKNNSLLILPTPKPGGGPSNAILRVLDILKGEGFNITTNLFSFWNKALLNVGLGIRFDVLQLLRFNRKVIYRVDGAFSKEVFFRQGRQWNHEYDKRNQKIKYAFEAANFVIYQSEFSKNILDSIVNRNSIDYLIIPNGVDVISFSPSGEPKVNLQPTIGCIGNFRDNRIKLITDIIRRLPYDHILYLVGRMDPQCESDLREFLQSKNQRTTLKVFPPVYGDQNLAMHYQNIDCFVHPVIGDTCSNAVIESLSCGVPVVLPEYSGSSELIGYGGLTVRTPLWENYSSFLEEYQQAITQVLSGHQQYAMKAREQALSCFDVRRIGLKYKEAIENC